MINDNINNKHNINNSKNYQTTTTKFLFNPILLFGTVSYDFIVAPRYSIFFSLLMPKCNLNLLQLALSLTFLYFIYLLIFMYIKKKNLLKNMNV